MAAPASAPVAVGGGIVIDPSGDPLPPQHPPEPAAALSAHQHAVVQQILNGPPKDSPKKKQLLEQKEFIKGFAEDLNKLISESLVELLQTYPHLQQRLGIKLEKGQGLDINEIFKRMNRAFLQEIPPPANEDDGDFELIKDESIPQLQLIHNKYRILLRQYDEDISTETCSKLLAKPLEEGLQRAIDDYVEKQFSTMKVLKKGVPVLGAAWALARVAMKVNNMGGLTILTNYLT